MVQDFSNIKDDKSFVLNLLPDELKLKHARLERKNDGTMKCVFTYVADDTLCSLAKSYDEQHKKIRSFYILGIIGFFDVFVGLCNQQALDDWDMLCIIIGVSLIVLAKILLIVNRKKYNNSKRKLYEYLRSKGLLLNH